MFDPTAYEYEASGKGYVVASVGGASGEVPYTCYIAKNSWLEKNGKAAEGFLRAITKAVKFIHEKSESEVAPYLTKYFEGTSEASISASVERYKQIDAWRTELSMTQESFERLQDVISNAGELTKRVNFTDLVNNNYAQKAYKDVYKI